MNLPKLEEIGLEPVNNILEKFGGWPVLQDDWNEDSFDWEQLVYIFRENGYSTDYLFDFSIATDLKNSTWRTIYFDQPSLGMSREYLIKGLEEENVRHYFNYMQKVAVLLGADPARAATELKASLDFEIKSVIEEYAKNITGKTETTPRWKSCVGSAAGSFSAAVGKMYVSKHFKEDAKTSMLEMVSDIREEFQQILNEISWMDD
eukprot:04800.XXX_207388_208497_1 [CDS] Oithona nana genome sequencing.